MKIRFHEIAIHGVVRKLLTYRQIKQTNNEKNNQSNYITSHSSSLVEVVINSIKVKNIFVNHYIRKKKKN